MEPFRPLRRLSAAPFFFFSLYVNSSDMRPLTFDILSSMSGICFSTCSQSSNSTDFATSLIVYSDDGGIITFLSVSMCRADIPSIESRIVSSQTFCKSAKRYSSVKFSSQSIISMGWLFKSHSPSQIHSTRRQYVDTDISGSLTSMRPVMDSRI
ncbi:hypothetical protein FGO68_gene9005 [Halteria grandinella]|uniref:Uncharacterized protein n=1 Tax=Halteria grandinella TaxID=5974 RepID=A0A8J8SWV7_HALGN|nr:hypothetical protein FGO68_gene9005 [Halteria grandinella]